MTAKLRVAQKLNIPNSETLPIVILPAWKVKDTRQVARDAKNLLTFEKHPLVAELKMKTS